MNEVEHIFDDASLIAEMSIRTQLTEVIADRELYMAICCALLKRCSGEVEIMDTELLMDATVFIAINEAKDGFRVWTEDNVLDEEVSEDSEQMDTG